MDKNNMELTKSLVTGLLKYNYSRITTSAYMDLDGATELSYKLTKTALMVVQAAKFAEQMDYHRCYATILDIEGMEGGDHYTEIKKYLKELKAVYPTKAEAALLEPVNVDWGRAVVPKTAPKPKVEDSSTSISTDRVQYRYESTGPQPNGCDPASEFLGAILGGVVAVGLVEGIKAILSADTDISKKK